MAFFACITCITCIGWRPIKVGHWMRGTHNVNHNVVCTFTFRLTDGIAQGMWNASALATYIFLEWGRSTKLVGYTQGMQGCAVALTSLPLGWLADRPWMGRSKVLKIISSFYICAIACTVTAVLLQPKTVHIPYLTTDSKYLVLCCACILWGSAQAAGPVVESLLADSVPTGSRSQLYSYLFSTLILSMSCGPLISAVVFWVTGNSWDVTSLERVILIGMAAALVPALALLQFDDKKALGHESDAVKQPLLPQGAGEDAAERGGQALLMKPGSRRCACLSTASVPYIMAVSDFITGVASGMTIRFMPIFLLQEVNLSPIAVNFVLAGTPLLLALCSVLGSPVSRVLGRVQTILFLKLSGVTLLAILGLHPPLWRQPWLVLPIYCIRTSLINASYPLQKSILMDFVPKDKRGMWNSFESLFVLGWSGSAVFGGIMLERGFAFTFSITALLQGLGTSVLFLLLPLIPRKEVAPHNLQAVAAMDTGPAVLQEDSQIMGEGSAGTLLTADREEVPLLNDDV